MMDNSEHNSTEQNVDSSGETPVSLGRILREAREKLGLSITEVADQIKFAGRQIEALEADEFEQLPEMTFVRGFVRSYAKILNLDASALLALLPLPEVTPQPLVYRSVEVPFPTEYTAQRSNLVWLGTALLLAVLIVIFAVWQYTKPVIESHETIKTETSLALPVEALAPEMSAPIEQPQEALPETKLVTQTEKPTDVETNAKPGVLRLVFDEEAWAEIRNRDDKILSSQVNPRGSELDVDGRAPFSLVIARAASVHVFHHGKPVDLTPYINSSSEVARLTLE